MTSIWSKTEELPYHSPLPGSVDLEAAVIGGGLAGILTAYFLMEQGIQTAVLEGGRLGSGQTQNTTAKVTSQHGLIYERLIRQFGKERAWKYAKANETAISEYERLIEKEKISCMWERLPSFLYTNERPEALQKECQAAVKLGLPAELVKENDLPAPAKAALCFHDQAQFHPLQFLKGISERLTIFEQTQVQAVKGDCIFTNRGVVKAKWIVFTSHFPFINFPGFYFMRMHQERSYVLALRNTQKLNGMYYGIDPDGLSFRMSGDMMLLGGGAHRTGKNREGGKYDMLWKKAQQFWPACELYTRYSAQDCVSLDKVPYVGRFSPTRPNWYVATGFGKWGMTSSMAAAQQISRQIAGKAGKGTSVFSPRRFVPSAAVPALLQETAESFRGLLKEILYFPGKEFDQLPKGQGAVIRYNGKKRGAYKDEKGTVYLVSTRCPHLGCQLEWNPDEKSWDCPCHGSRFNFRGELMDNPAQCHLKHREQFYSS